MFVERSLAGLNLASGPDHGPPLLFLHGVLRGWRDWLTVMPALGSRWRVLGLDFRGHGRSGRRDRYLVRDYLDDAAAVVDGVFRAPGVVVGHSLGGLVALGLAARLPERISAVVLEDPPAATFLANLHRTPYYAQFQGFLPLAGSRQPVSVIARELAELRLPGPDGTVFRLGDLRDAASLRFSARCLQDLDPAVIPPLIEGRWLDGVSLTEWASRVRCPVLLLRGNERLGGMLPRADADALLVHLADAALIEMPQTGHLIHLTEAATMVRLLHGFLESVR